MDNDCTVLVIEDDDEARAPLCEFLGAAGYRVRAARGGGEALAELGAAPAGAVLLDLVMPEPDGFEVLRRVRERDPALPVIVLSALSQTEDVVRAMKLGATDYLPKPFDPAELELVLRRALDGRGRARADAARNGAVPEAPDPGAIPLLSGAMDRVRELVERIADTDVPVLLIGESGVGKDVIARRIHAESRRAARPFVKINCAALPGELLESELFGHEKGAFTGAHAEKPGKFELAHEGTIFLDEIGEMDPRLQAKLLQVLQDEEFYRVGGKRPVRVDARVVVATNRNLELAIRQGSFREDLFYRLNVVTVRVPPLRERKEEIGPLVRHFVRKYRERYQGGLEEVPPEVMERFHAYDWPGNVRELENLVRRLVVLRDPAMVLGELGAPRAAAGPPPANVASNHVRPGASPLHAALPEDAPLKDVARRAARIAEREAILRALMRTGWNKRKAAKRLQVSYKALLYKIKDCGIVDPRDAATVDEA
ncbi:sigma-54-dependent transcriptional regulator [Anaeromyxobacter dehalogenans]|uniref:Two component, sigma54 specific, transcriptional regulator, Fis family n=1 Tax=Anaeromyxobacter dehalogenans (strain 2CP-C) TaxID=290397 RepID=Q2IL88_ANADE|nr:sigma-54 dependent transcriptional regulator [Anaeromyxobacter dehalogenans]ABC82421.1 two component, sigma54 specific, transcriptional regulator, Fis family [Anaeromyxobacter dehalogenans 2CP-C]